MAILDAKYKRLIAGISVALISLAFIPWVAPYVSGILNWKLGSTDFTLGTVFALFGLYEAWQLVSWSLTGRFK